MIKGALSKQINHEKVALNTFGFLLAVTLLSAAAANIFTSATTYEDEVEIAIAPSCSLSSTGTDSHTTTLMPGVLSSDIGTTNVTVVCNDTSGYDIYAIGYTNNSWGNNNLTTSINGDTYNIATNNYTSGNTSGWAMKLAEGTSASEKSSIVSPFNGYTTVPSSFTKVATLGKSVTGASGTSFTTTYRVFPAASQVAGTYTGQVKYTLVHPQNAPAPTITYMQDLTTSSIATLLPSTGSTTTVYDKRDDQSYTIAKFSDGNYWMTTNLNLAGETELYSDDSDVPSGYDKSSGNPYYTLPESNSRNPGYSPTAVYNSGNTNCDGENPCYSYYGWVAATASSGSSITSGTRAAEASICPKGWHLPTTLSSRDNATDLRSLGIAVGGTQYLSSYSTSTTPSSTSLYGKLTNPPYNFSSSGIYSSPVGYVDGKYGSFWSANAYNSNAYTLYVQSSEVNLARSTSRSAGAAVRCVFTK